VCDGVYLAIDNPMRHYLDVWMAMFLATAVQSGDEPLLEGRSYSHALVVVYSALRLALVAHEQRASTTTQTYEETLVHEVMDGEWANVPTGVAGAPHRFATARSDALGDLLKTENLCAASTEGDATLMLFKAFGRLVKLTEEYQRTTRVVAPVRHSPPPDRVRSSTSSWARARKRARTCHSVAPRTHTPAVLVALVQSWS
jgi:hypothetical protein